jgi:hypothetical protein
MTENQVENLQENKPNDKELNFRALEAKYKRELEQERSARIEAERLTQQALERNQEEEEVNSDPYVDDKRLDKKLARFGQSTQSEIQKAMEIAKHAAKEELKQEMWMEKNPDFYEVMKHADKLYQADQELAETILKMPEGFDRQKLVFKSIKGLGLHQEKKQPSIQDKIDSNRKNPYYQPSGVASPAYSAGGDFSAAGQKNAYNKMQELKSKLRM